MIVVMVNIRGAHAETHGGRKFVFHVQLVDGVEPRGHLIPGATVRVRRVSIVQKNRQLRLPTNVLVEPAVQAELAVSVNASDLMPPVPLVLQAQVPLAPQAQVPLARREMSGARPAPTCLEQFVYRVMLVTVVDRTRCVPNVRDHALPGFTVHQELLSITSDHVPPEPPVFRQQPALSTVPFVMKI